MANMKLGEKGLSLIKSFESCRLTAYKAIATEQYYTIGWGHYGADVKEGQTISQADADALFVSDLARYVKYTNTYVTAFVPNQNQFDALVSFCYNCGPGNLKKLLSGRTPDQVATAMMSYNKSDGKVLNGLTRRRIAEQELFNTPVAEEKAMGILVGSARIDENGKTVGGAAGDQTGKEVATQSYYLHNLGWYMYRAKDISVANALASAMKEACDNDNIGYDQGNRLGVITQIKNSGSLGAITEKTEADCSSLVRACCIQAGFDPGNFTTSNEGTCLTKTGKFEGRVAVTSSTVLHDGDILVTKKKGHTVIVVSGNPRKASGASTANKQTVKPDAAQSMDKSLAGTYKVTASALNLRAGASTMKTSIAIMKRGETVRCYGYYTLANGTKWLYVQYGSITGFCSSKYLAKA